MIEVQNVTKSFESIRAVDAISFSVRPGEIFGLIGPNGAGKSTTIRMIMNIIAPDSGTITFNGRPLSEPDKNLIGYLPEERGLYKKMKVKDLLLFLAEIKEADRKLTEERIESWLRRFDLEKWKNRKIEELSKGMAQKVQFIGTIIHDPPVLLFDEPFSGLDPISQNLLLEIFLELKNAGKTIIFSTHIMDHAERICERILLINMGKSVLSGSLSDIKSRFGTNTVQIEFDGDGSFIEKLPYVKRARTFPRWTEAELSGTDAAELLYRDLAGKVRVRRFQLIEPSLHSIFVQLVGNTYEEAANA
ncbi:MAG: ABC transporter ATP-binding protein [Spirochaetota bacterium]|jgi:ABC-2 type transport system ATP-binding protein|uniref:ABC transporter ATP-binding protein n=1 Tax=Gracilinema caldarium TaxID=215591 RepID=UPI0026F2A6F4|nr:ATP-binding cassette domain-containing protein [Gracilinema caldarium]